MIGNSVRQLALFLVAAFVLTACGPQASMIQTTTPLLVTETTVPEPTTTLLLTETMTPASSHTASATPCLGLVAIPDSMFEKSFGWPYIDVPGIPVQGMECAVPEEIVRQVMLDWLETVKITSPGQRCGLEDYMIDKMMIRATNTSQYDIVVTVTYHVKPGRFGDCGWITDRGQFEEDGWIKTGDTFAIYRENGYFKLIKRAPWGV